ncbi:MAG: ATP-dependent Clp protease proteolytic subunit [Methanimicrococcus sp.]|nr:ATP-dependent Clp protease proteolytic subunit [Methanimicrococcus sp.]
MVILNDAHGLTKTVLTDRLKNIENYFDADCISYYGQINEDSSFALSKIIAELAQEGEHRSLVFILTTTGGSIGAVERIVNIIRHFYDKVTFLIPDYAYSAGTLFCMSGNEIYMNYFSVLGPIDPQILNKDGRWVSALSYLEKVSDLIQKSADGSITPIEFTILRDFNLGELKELERAVEHTKNLLLKFLIKYKFKNWVTRSASGLPVTDEYKKNRAQTIADRLGGTEWYSHGRPINIKTLEEMGIQINDYSGNGSLTKLICDYYYPLEDYIKKNSINNSLAYVHTRRFF